MSESVAIVGSRDFGELDLVVKFVRSLPSDTVVVSGGAPGVDSKAESEARKCGLRVVIYKPDWVGDGNIAGFIRNRRIVKSADRVVAFWDGKSTGTKNTLAIAKRLHVPVEVIHDVQLSLF